MKFSIVAIFILCLAFPALAQDEEPVAPLRLFNVEVIVFAYAEDVSLGTEIFVPDALPEPTPLELSDTPDVREARPDSGSGSSTDTDDEPFDDGISEMQSFSILTESELKMQDIANRLRRLDVYDVMLHVGWTQSGVAKDQAIEMQLDMLAPVPSRLSGKFTLYLSRFLHLVTDLELAASDRPAVPVAIERRGRFSDEDPAPQVGAVVYRIQEDRIFRSDETRYYDHPKFGVIARITRYEEPETGVADVLPGSATPATNN